jgi:hypothetical protein
MVPPFFSTADRSGRKQEDFDGGPYDLFVVWQFAERKKTGTQEK